MKIAVVGAGLFGTMAAVRLVQAGFDVDLYEKNSDILTAASGINQYRLHRGYHYPRSKSTALSSRYAEDTFRMEFKEAVRDDNEHYYCIAKEGSRVSGEQYVNFCKECDLEHETANIDHVHGHMVDLVIKGKEAVIDPIKLRELCWEKIKKNKIKIHLNTAFLPHQIDEYDFVINATYANSNFILERYPDARRQYQFELVEKPVLRLSPKFKGMSIVVMDGPFFCIDPYGETDMHVMGNVVHAIHATNTGFFPEIPEEYKPLLNKGIVESPNVTRIEKFLETATSFMPDMKEAEYVGSMFTVRAVLPNVDATDERPTLVSKVSDKIIHVFSGKLGNCVEAADEVVRLIKTSPAR